MSATVLTVAAAKKANIWVMENGRGTKAVHDVVVAWRANRRSGTANTKTKAEVTASGKKPWWQKGTGRVRAGYTSSPVWTGGGVVFGPKPRDYSKKVSKQIRKLAFLKALSTRILGGDVLVTDDVAVTEPKTKNFVKLLQSLTEEERVLVIANQYSAETYRAARNVRLILLNTAGEKKNQQVRAYRQKNGTKNSLNNISAKVART